MKSRNAFFLALFLSVGLCQATFCSATKGAFVLSIDPATLTFNGAGNHTVNVLITHDGSGESTFSGLTLRFGEVANASLGVLPAGASINSATAGTVFVGDDFDLDQDTNTVAFSTFTSPNSDVGVSQTVSLFTMEFSLGNQQSYDIGVDLRAAVRGNFGSGITDISTEFFDPISSTTDFAFTLNAVAVPEPGSLLVLAGMGIGGVCYRKRHARAILVPRAVIEIAW